MKYYTGDEILTTEPLCYVVNHTHKGNICDLCLRKCKNELKRCTGCQFMFYCSHQCERADWQEFHRYECAILRFQSTHGISALICNLIRMCIKYQYSEAACEKAWMMYDGTQRAIENLISLSDVRTHLQETVLSGLISRLNSLGIVVDKDTLIYRFGQLAGNAMSIFDETCFFHQEYPSVGCGLYVEASIFDHSCRPNAMCVFDGPTLTIRAITEIDTDKEKITISYNERAATFTRDLRRADIHKIRYFLCLCDICTDENYSDAPRDELNQLISRMLSEMDKRNTNEVEQISRRVFSLIQSILGRYSKTYIKYMLYLVEFKCKQILKHGVQSDVDSKMTWTEFESCLRITHGTEHPFYKACLRYGEILMPSNTPQSRKSLIEFTFD